MLEDKYKYINSLVAKCKAGDNNSIFELYEFYRPLMLSSISRCVAKEPKLSVYKEDILADSIFVFIKLVNQYDPNLTYFSYFLSTRIDINLFRYVSDKYVTNEYSDDNIDESSLVDPFNKLTNVIVIQSALNKLNVKDRIVLDLYYFQGLDQKEAAEELKISQSSFSKRLSKAHESMKKILGDDFLDF
jgi:RNA polymerase sigma factor (sigma-70 family)